MASETERTFFPFFFKIQKKHDLTFLSVVAHVFSNAGLDCWQGTVGSWTAAQVRVSFCTGSLVRYSELPPAGLRLRLRRGRPGDGGRILPDRRDAPNWPCQGLGRPGNRVYKLRASGGVRRILVRESMPPCRLRRKKFRKFDYKVVPSEVYPNKYVVSIAPLSA